MVRIFSPGNARELVVIDQAAIAPPTRIRSTRRAAKTNTMRVIISFFDCS
jgi:hypothetical protein